MVALIAGCAGHIRSDEASGYSTADSTSGGGGGGDPAYSAEQNTNYQGSEGNYQGGQGGYQNNQGGYQNNQGKQFDPITQ